MGLGEVGIGVCPFAVNQSFMGIRDEFCELGAGHVCGHRSKNYGPDADWVDMNEVQREYTDMIRRMFMAGSRIHVEGEMKGVRILVEGEWISDGANNE